MKINKLIKMFALCAGMVLCACGAMAADGIIVTQKAVEPGVWTSDYNGAMAYAEANNIPMFVFWANAGCTHCASVEREMNKEPFLSWMDQRKILMVFVESDAAVKKWIKKYAPVAIKEFPYAAVYWPKNTKGTMVLEGFSAWTSNVSRYGVNPKDSKVQQLMDTIDFLIPDWDPSGVVPSPDPVYYTVNFVVDSAKGTVTGELSQQVESGKGATAPTVKAKDGWEFTGWDKSFSKVTSDLTVTATFSAVVPDPDPVYYTVNFVVDAEKGTATGELSQQVLSGKGAVAPTVQAKDGWEFAGWDKSFSKVTANLTVNATFTAVKERDTADPSVVFKKARTISAVVYGDDDLAGTASLKLAKISKAGTVKVSLTISLFTGTKATASFTAKPNEYCDLEGVFPFKSAMGGAMECFITYDDGEFSVEAENDWYFIELGNVQIGGSFDTDELSFSADVDMEFSDDWEMIVDPPSGEPVYVRNGTKFSFNKAPSVKYKKYKEDGETWYDLVGLDDDVRTNVNALKLSYKSSTGAFSGSFKVYLSNESSIEDGKSPKLKTITLKVSGIVVNGVGVGSVMNGKKVVGSCTLE